jgi:plasmid segregation protein ParM
MISVDIGYGYTKAVASNGVRISFPSVISPAPVDLMGGMYQDGPGYRVKVTTNGSEDEKLVGEAAMQHMAVRGFVAREEKPVEIHDLLLMTAACVCNADEKDTLAVGLPLAYYRAQKTSLKKRLAKLEAYVGVNGHPPRIVSFGNVSVFPQGTGALMTLGADGLDDGITGVVDIGTYTTDYLLFNVQNGVPMPILESCGSVEAGIYLAQRAIASEFERQSGYPLPQQMYQWAFDRTQRQLAVPYQGKDMRLFEVWERVQNEIADTIASYVLAAWGAKARMLSMTAFAGGGASLFSGIKKMFPCPVIAKEGYYANAVGFLKMLVPAS